MPRVDIHTASMRFPRRQIQPLPSLSSTWSLADTEGHADENTKPHPEPHPELAGQVTPGEGESRPQGTSTVNTCEPMYPLKRSRSTTMSASVSDIQQRLEKLDPPDDNYLPALRELLNHQALRPHVQGLDESGLERLIEILDRVSVTDTNVHRH